MTITTTFPVRDHEPVDPGHARPGGPRKRRVFRHADKLAHLTAQEDACQSGDGGTYLRREGLYSPNCPNGAPGVTPESWAPPHPRAQRSTS